jgi:signal transduction histidine kinase
MAETAAFDAIGNEQVRSVGTTFLRLRPFLVAPAGALVLAVSVAGGASRSQLGWLSVTFALVIGFFAYESWRARRAKITLDALGNSLSVTLGLIACVAWLTGAVDSPLLPVAFAPVVVGLAAFGRSRRSLGLVALFAALLLFLLLAAPLRPFPSYAPWQLRALTLGAFALVLSLIGTGVVGLVDAHRRAAVELDRVRTSALRQAAHRTRELETVSAKVAHEIRNPLVSIKGLVQLLSRGASGQRDAERFAVVLTEIERLESIVRDSLAFARPLDELQRSSARLEGLLRDVASVVEGQAESQGVALEVCTEEVEIQVDENRLKQALLNLLTNALEATPAGGKLRLSAKVLGDAVILEVSDSGVGMSPRVLERVGTPFFTTRAHGTGLGVAIARGIVEQHGGELGFDSSTAGGTRVSIKLPLRFAGDGGAGR